MSSGAANMLEFDVLFYKRSVHSKVHKSKGASKIDGILSLHITKQTVSLRCAQDETSDDDNSEEGQEKLTWKERRKQRTAKSGPRGTVYTGKLQGDLTQNTIQEDTTIVLGSYDVEVVNRRSKVVHGSENKRLAIVNKPISQKTTTIPLFKRTNAQSRGGSGGSVLPIKRKPPPQPVDAQKQAAVKQQQRRPPAQPVVAAQPEVRQRKPPAQPTTITTAAPFKRPLPADLSKFTVHVAPVVKTGALLAPVVAKNTIRPRLAWTPPTSSITSSAVGATVVTVLPHIPLPGGLRNVLRPHQVSGVDFLWRALQKDGGAILADEMGLGKTLMSIAVISAWYRSQRSHSHIVVCPSSLVRNWEAEFDKWLGKASQPKRMIIRTGGEEGLQRVRAFAGNQSQKKSNRVGQVLVISYDFFRTHSTVIQQAVDGSIGLLLVDEGHRLKNTSGSLTMTALESIQADGRLLITASLVQNNLSEFYSLVQFVRPGLLGDLSTFRKEFERPITAANRKNASRADRDLATRQSRELEGITRCTILRRLQSEVLASVLPPRTEVLLFCKLSTQQTQLYQSITAERSNKLSGSCSMSDALETMTSLRKLCTHPCLLNNAKEDLFRGSQTNVEASGKLAVLAILLRQIRETGEEDKVVIVSNFTSALSLVEELILKTLNLTYLRLDGNICAHKRQALVDTFNRTSASRTFCFLLSAKAGGCGLNLVGANKLILFDPDYNPSTCLQAMGRIYRTGQKRATTIYRLFSTGTLEEIIYQRQLQKGTLASVTVDGREEETAKFSSEELKECMTLKMDTKSDTKDKMGDSWIDFDGAISSGDSTLDDAIAKVFETGQLSFAHVVDEETTERRSLELDQAGTHIESANDSSETSEEEFDNTESSLGLTRAKRAPKTTVLEDSSSDSDEEAEFT